MVFVDNLYDAAYSRLYARRETLQLFGFAILCIVPAMYLLIQGQYSLLTFLVVAATFLISWPLDKTTSLMLVLLFEFLLGDLRRVVNTYAGYPKLDPLLLAGPVFALCIAIPILLKVKVSDPLSKVVLGVTAVMTLEMVNPRQGSILVGMSGALFMLIPMCWFWIGRAYATEQIIFRLAYRVLLPLAVTAALLGIYQTYVGFLPWEQSWIKHALENGYVALSLGQGHIRSFGFSVNSAEYGTLLMLGSVCCFAALFAGRRAYALLLPLLLTAQILASMRGLLLKTLMATVMMWAVRGKDVRSWVKRLVFGGILGLGLLAYSVRHATSDDAPPAAAGPAASSAGLATSHVTQGLAHPLDPKYSTAGLHTLMFLGGFGHALKNPLGMGLGMVTLGAAKFGTTEGTGTSEIDISDAFITMGFVGGPLFLMAIVIGYLEAAKYVQTGPPQLGFFIVGLLVGMLGAWMPLGQYAIGPFVWFCIGFLCRQGILARVKVEARTQGGAGARTNELESVSPQLAGQ